MTYEELVREVRRLTVEERLALLNVIRSSLQADSTAASPRGVPVSQVEGMLRAEGPMPSDEEVKDAYTDYLIQKYG